MARAPRQRTVSNAARPTHLLVLDMLQQSVEKRIRDHETKCGGGLPDQPYREMVGRIREGKALIAEITDLLKKLRTEDLED